MLHLATYHDHVDVAKLPISKGADKDAIYAYGRTPLYIAAKIASDSVARLLLSNDANKDAEDVFKCTPLHFAAKQKSVSLVGLLIKYGANPTTKNLHGQSPIDLTCEDACLKSLLEQYSRLYNSFLFARASLVDTSIAKYRQNCM